MVVLQLGVGRGADRSST